MQLMGFPPMACIYKATLFMWLVFAYLLCVLLLLAWNVSEDLQPSKGPTANVSQPDIFRESAHLVECARHLINVMTFANWNDKFLNVMPFHSATLNECQITL